MKGMNYMASKQNYCDYFEIVKILWTTNGDYFEFSYSCFTLGYFI